MRAALAIYHGPANRAYTPYCARPIYLRFAPGADLQSASGDQIAPVKERKTADIRDASVAAGLIGMLAGS